MSVRAVHRGGQPVPVTHNWLNVVPGTAQSADRVNESKPV
jgi:hypothetical protein